MADRGRGRLLSEQHVPARVSEFIGRAAELADVRRLVVGQRLVTLTGAGGCGKTRLAIEALKEVGAEFPDGI
jgi:hypothetical protein